MRANGWGADGEQTGGAGGGEGVERAMGHGLGHWFEKIEEKRIPLRGALPAAKAGKTRKRTGPQRSRRRAPAGVI
ncbi:hypothetical protein GCM10027093_28630 [Paraburkholderia jirisanensis]